MSIFYKIEILRFESCIGTEKIYEWRKFSKISFLTVEEATSYIAEYGGVLEEDKDNKGFRLLIFECKEIGVRRLTR